MLRDALAAALSLDDTVPMPPGSRYYQDLAQRVLADPTFRAALAESIAEALHDLYGCRISCRPEPVPHRPGETYFDDAATIVTRMLGEQPEISSIVDDEPGDGYGSVM